MEQGAEIDRSQELVRQVQHGEINAVKKSIDVGSFSANTLDSDGCSLLHWAAINNRVQIATYLLSKGADVNKSGGILQEIPLQWACRSAVGYGFTHMVKLLLDADSNFTHKSTSGNDSLHIAVQSGNANVAFILMSQAKADPNTADNEENTPLLWLMKYGKRLGAPRSVDIIRLLISCGADVTHRDNNGDTALHIMASNLTSYDLDLSIAFLIMQNGGSHLEQMENGVGLTPKGVAQKKKNNAMEGFLSDWYIYNNTPEWLVVFNTAVLVWSFFASMHYWWYYSLSFMVPLFYAYNYTSQSSIVSKTSRQAHGFAWGIIISASHGYFVYAQPFLDWKWAIIVIIMDVLIVTTLYLSSVTPASRLNKVRFGHQGQESQSLGQLAYRIVDHGQADGLSKSPEPDSVDDGQDAPPPRICTTCLVDRSAASAHCGQCNECRVALDHHCVFVNNCVGKGNRRVFSLFCLFASSGCFLAGTMLLYTQYVGTRCPHVKWKYMRLSGYVDVQVCMLREHPSIPILTYITFLVALWIATIFVGQMYMVATETTTYESMTGHRRQKVKAGNFKGCYRSIKNLVHFFRTGQYTVSYTPIETRKSNSSSSDCCAGEHLHEI